MLSDDSAEPMRALPHIGSFDHVTHRHTRATGQSKLIPAHRKGRRCLVAIQQHGPKVKVFHTAPIDEEWAK